MNKTININLGGFFFHIDESAYLKLQRYLDAISRSLSEDAQGKNEIIADIEARISELLSEKITDARQVVNEQDIDAIILIMGQPEDYAEAEEGYSNASHSYRRNNNNTKKLFRDGDDKFLGGVASGMAHYFSIDAIWVRLAMLFLFFSAGVGVLVYIILWILLPEAKTTAEKLQMEGEPVNIDNIERKIREEFTHVSENVKDFANNASEKIKDGANEFSEKINKSFKNPQKKNNGLDDFFNTIGNILLTIFKLIGKVIGALLVFFAAGAIISLLIGGFSIGSLEFLNLDAEFLNYPPFFYDSILPRWLITLCTFVLAVIPFIILFVLGLRILSNNVKRISKTTSLTLLGIWILALFVIIFRGIEFGASHANYGKSIEKVSLNISETDTLTIKMKNNDKLFYSDNLRRSSRKYNVEVDNTPMIYTNDVAINLKNSDTGNAYFIIKKESKGRTHILANKQAETITYNYEINNNEIILDAYFLSGIKNRFKDEEIEVTFYLPENYKVKFSNSVKNFLFAIKNSKNLNNKALVKHYFIMKNNTLNCLDCKTDKLENNTINTNKTI